MSLLTLLSACQQPSGKWVALQDTNVYKHPDDADVIIFSVKKGDVCALGQERMAKIYLYREIKCKQGVGWISYPYPFKLVEK